MVSLWWVLAAFVVGSYFGIFVMALLHMSGNPEEEPVRRAAGRRSIRHASWPAIVGRQPRVAA
jgi:hypothetical protein